jgi:hypothetical protein
VASIAVSRSLIVTHRENGHYLLFLGEPRNFRLEKEYHADQDFITERGFGL